MMGLLSVETEQMLRAEKIRIIALFGIKRKDEPPFFLSGLWPADEDSFILDPSLYYAAVEADDPEEAVRVFRDKLFGGL